MKALRKKFNEVSKKNPDLSSLMCFRIACRFGPYHRNTISRWFGKLVDKGDYEGVNKRILIESILKANER